MVLSGIWSTLFGWGCLDAPAETLPLPGTKRPNYPLCPPVDAPTHPLGAPTSLPWPPSEPWGPVETKPWLLRGHSEVRRLPAEFSSRGRCSGLGYRSPAEGIGLRISQPPSAAFGIHEQMDLVFRAAKGTPADGKGKVTSDPASAWFQHWNAASWPRSHSQPSPRALRLSPPGWNNEVQGL